MILYCKFLLIKIKKEIFGFLVFYNTRIFEIRLLKKSSRVRVKQYVLEMF
jgi:hypothetical protein